MVLITVVSIATFFCVFMEFPSLRSSCSSKNVGEEHHEIQAELWFPLQVVSHKHEGGTNWKGLFWDGCHGNIISEEEGYCRDVSMAIPCVYKYGMSKCLRSSNMLHCCAVSNVMIRCEHRQISLKLFLFLLNVPRGLYNALTLVSISM